MMVDSNSKRPRTGLHKARAERGWTQQELADHVGTTKINISRWENGTTFPSPYFRRLLSESFGKTPAELDLVQPPSPPVHKTWTIPLARTPFFTGREDLLALLHRRLSIAQMAALTHPQALYGLGGIGKTRTAAEYAFRHGNDYTHVFWIRAASRETLLADFVALARRLGLPEKDGTDQPRVVAAVQRWLAGHEDWLIILDNADDLLQALEFLPTNHKGYVLLTTRAQAAGAIATSVEVEKLSVHEGTLLLLRWCRLLDSDTPLNAVQTSDRAAAERIVKEMDGLPLAIVQAGAFIQETGCSLADYLDLYATHRRALLARSSRLLSDYPDTVATTWSISFQQVERTNPAAAELLRLCAFLAPDAIPEELLIRGASELGEVLRAVVVDSLQFNETLGVLLKYSLIQRDASTHMLSIHRLVQAVLRENLDQQTRRACVERTVLVVNAALPDSGAGADTHYQSYLPHVQECAARIEQYQLHFPQAAQLLYRTADFLYSHGLYLSSQALHRQALAVRKQALGSEHPSVAESLNALAVLARLQGDFEDAEKLHKQALSLRESTLGREHPMTGRSFNDLGVLYCSWGKYEHAELFLQQALSIHKQSLGSEHYGTLLTVLNLANLYIEQHQYKRAGQLLRQTLTTGERVLEAEHPVIVHTLGLLARLCYEQKEFEQAASFWQRSLTILQKTHGPEHPALAERLNDLAELAFVQGDYAQAQSLCQQALDICEKTLGADHPDTIAYREHFARIVNKRGAGQNE